MTEPQLSCAEQRSSAVLPAPELCVVVPVLNERDNVAPLVNALRATLDGLAWEVVFVDDGSTDGTRDRVAAIGRADSRVRLLHRRGRRGLALAFIEGVECGLAPYVAAMDGDLQHDETLLPNMLDLLQSGAADVVVGSRYVTGGDLGEWDRTRASMSDLATRVSRLVLRADVTDPMSGFFMLCRAVFDRAAPRLSAIGFKILLDLLASLPERPRVRELPYTFRSRVAGESKLDAGVLFDFGLLLLDKLIGAIVPVRFVMFAIKLKGKRVLPGLVVFAAICAVGAAANLNVASLMVNAGHRAWWTAGVVGAAMSLVWNYAVGSTLTWRHPRDPADAYGWDSAVGIFWRPPA